MINIFLVILGKFIIFVSRTFNIGNGSTWPGHIALSINKYFVKELIKANLHLKIVLIAGTNGKTTTGKLIQTILEKANYKVFQNDSGANLLNGIASSIVLHSNVLCKINYDYAIFEVDESTLPLALKEITPDYLVLLNLFRDQLDRYGEVNTIAKKWQKALDISTKTTLILNADDPQIAYLGVQSNPPGRWIRSGTSVFYFGLDDKTLNQTSHQHAVDSTYCPNCNSKLIYNVIYYSHLGDWQCNRCQYKRPKDIFSSLQPSTLVGIYNLYNILAASVVAKNLRVTEETIAKALKTFIPAFGRQEILDINGKKVVLFLSKNPTSFNESLRTIANLDAKNVLLVLNDRVPDGQDVSWIWDVDFEDYVDKFKNIIVSGDRVYDMALRIKYTTQNFPPSFGFAELRRAGISKVKIYENLNDAIKESLKKLIINETLYILSTYSAMLEVRKILMGRKIL